MHNDNLNGSKKGAKERIRFSLPQLIIPLLVGVLAFLSYDQMLWKMTLYAPMYPKGLVMQAYGTKILGDLTEINLLNHYVGMHPITEDSITLMWLYPIGVASLVLAGIAAAVLPQLRKWIAVGVMMIPVSMLVTIQYYLYYFGHNLNPDAPIDLPPFTPLVLGKSTIVVFHSFSVPGFAMAFYLLSAIIIWFGPKLLNRFRLQHNPRRMEGLLERKAHAFPSILIGLGLLVGVQSAQANELQNKISAAQAGDTIRVAAGVYHGPLTIEKAITIIGLNGAIIDGDRTGSVVTVKADNVLIEGLTIRRSGFEIHEDAAGISISGDNVTVKNNRIQDVYFGIHAIDCGSIFILGNDIEPGLEYTSRPGHGINVWNVKSAEIRDNQIRNGRDGILLTYVEKVTVDKNYVTQCRYGLHSMYSRDIIFSNNTLEDNLLGIALMYSKKMLAKDNLIQRHRRGSSPYGFLLKDLDNLTMEGNRIIGNQIGIFADAVSLENNSSSVLRDNVIAGNEVALSMQSNVRLSFYNNSVIDNLVDFEKQGLKFNSECKWSDNGHGNYWGNYRGFDNNGDGIGELTYSVEDLTEHVIDRNSAARAFLYTPSHIMLESVIRMFPIFRPEPLLRDSSPMTRLPVGVNASIVSTTSEQIIAAAFILLWVMSIYRLRRWRPLQTHRLS